MQSPAAGPNFEAVRTKKKTCPNLSRKNDPGVLFRTIIRFWEFWKLAIKNRPTARNIARGRFTPWIIARGALGRPENRHRRPEPPENIALGALGRPHVAQSDHFPIHTASDENKITFSHSIKRHHNGARMPPSPLDTRVKRNLVAWSAL